MGKIVKSFKMAVRLEEFTSLIDVSNIQGCMQD